MSVDAIREAKRRMRREVVARVLAMDPDDRRREEHELSRLFATLPVAELGIANVPPSHGGFGLTRPRILAPGKPDESVLLHRMTLTGLGRMPHIGSRVPHEKAIELVREWIEQLPTTD